MSSIEICLNELLELSSHIHSVDQINNPSSIEFAKSVIARQPVIFQNSIDDWPAFQHWNLSYFAQKLQNSLVTVAVTARGQADAVCGIDDASGQQIECFMLPHEQQMTFAAFRRCLLEQNENTALYYLQKQNGNFTDEFGAFQCDLGDFGASGHPFSFAHKIFDAPDALNLWIGTDKSVSSLHKDPYDNLYAVIKGKKHFRLYPPTDAAVLHVKKHKVYEWKPIDDNGCKDEPPALKTDFVAAQRSDIGEIDWIDEEHRDSRASPIDVTVLPGEVLYLPAYWFHRVSQSNCPLEKCCIAVNAWFDPPASADFALQRFVGQMKALCSLYFFEAPLAVVGVA